MAENTAKVQKLFDSIVELSIMEVVELVKKMEDELGVSAAATVAVAAAAPGAAAEPAADRDHESEQSHGTSEPRHISH